MDVTLQELMETSSSITGSNFFLATKWILFGLTSCTPAFRNNLMAPSIASAARIASLWSPSQLIPPCPFVQSKLAILDMPKYPPRRNTSRARRGTTLAIFCAPNKRCRRYSSLVPTSHGNASFPYCIRNFVPIALAPIPTGSSTELDNTIDSKHGWEILSNLIA